MTYSTLEKLSLFLFTDDTNILYADENIKITETTVNNELIKVSNWLTANRLTLNIKKSNFAIFRPYQKQMTIKANIMIHDNETNKTVTLESKNYVKYLGILIDSHLTFKYHIEHTTVKLSKNVGMLAKLRHFVPRKTLLQIYQSLIFPYINYAITVWSRASKRYLDKLLRLQKRALRFIYSAERNDHAIPLFVDDGVLPVKFLYFESVCCLMYDVRNKTVASNILNLFTDRSEISHLQNPIFNIK